MRRFTFPVPHSSPVLRRHRIACISCVVRPAGGLGPFGFRGEVGGQGARVRARPFRSVTCVTNTLRCSRGAREPLPWALGHGLGPLTSVV